MISIDLWISALTKPKETFASAAKSKVMWSDAIVPLLIVGVVGGVIGGLVTMMTFSQTMAKVNEQLQQLGIALPAAVVPQFGITEVIVNAIVTPIGLVIGMFVVTAIVFAIARMIGGKGNWNVDFIRQFYLTTISGCPLYLISIAANALIILSLSFATISGLISLLVAVYGLYLLYLIVKEVHRL